MSKRSLAAAAISVGVLGAGSLYVVTDRSSDSPVEAAVTTPTDTETVSRGDLIEETKAVGNVGFGAAMTLPIEAKGLVTAIKPPGSIVQPGEVLAMINGLPVYLASGSTPLYRELRRVPSTERDTAGDRVGQLTGDDVKQLQEFLLAGGFDVDGHLSVDGLFGKTTEKAVKAWQRTVGHPATGKVDRTQLVFVADAVRISEAPAVGEEFSGVQVTSNVAKITTEVDAKQAAFFDVGATVNLGTSAVTSTGTVTESTPKVADDGKRTLEIEIEPDAEFGSAMSVEVTAERTLATDVPLVPVRALVALADRGWALQVSGRGLVPVEVVTVQNGQAQIDGVDEGTTVEVPA